MLPPDRSPPSTTVSLISHHVVSDANEGERGKGVRGKRRVGEVAIATVIMGEVFLML